MEEDGEHGGSQISFPWLKELVSTGVIPPVSQAHLPMRQNIWRPSTIYILFRSKGGGSRTVCPCGVSMLRLAYEYEQWLYDPWLSARHCQILLRQLFPLVWIDSVSHSTFINWMPPVCCALFYFFYILTIALGWAYVLIPHLQQGNKLRR